METATFTAIECHGDTALQEHFLRVASILIQTLGAHPTQAEVTATIEQFIELFRALELPARKSVQGLWAELFLIARSRRPQLLAKAWHILPSDQFDFGYQDERIEVKSSSDGSRRHFFALEQLRPSADVKVLVASVVVQRLGAGLSIEDIADKLLVRLRSASKLAAHIEFMIGLTLGADWRLAAEERFDWQRAVASLRLFAADAVPCVNPSVPPEVSQVHFRSDLSGCTPIDLSAAVQRGPLFDAVLPVVKRSDD